MRTFFVVALLALALMPAVQGQSGSDPVVHEVKLMLGGSTTAVSEFDIIDDHGKQIVIEVIAQDKDFGGEILLVDVTMTIAGQTITKALTYQSNSAGVSSCADSGATECKETWSTTFEVDDKRLLVGDHPIHLRVFDRNQGQFTCTGTCGTVQVPSLKMTWDDQSATPLTMALRHVSEVGGSYPTQQMGPADKLQADVKLGDTTAATWALQHVRYTSTVNGVVSPAKSLASPYLLGAAALAEGDQTVQFTATDRGKRTVSFSVHAFVDTLAPEVELTVPTVYKNVSFPLVLDVTDANPYTASVTIGDETQTATGGPGDALDAFLFQIDEIGEQQILVRVIDGLNNQFLQQFNTTVVNATTDSTITVEVTPAYPLPEENVTVRFIARQQSGVAPLPFNVTLEVEGLGTVFSQEVIVPLNKPYEFLFERSYLPGMYDFNATILAAAGINETDSSDQVDLGSFEVFLGKVIHKEDSWYVRMGPNNEASHAVSPGGSLHNMTAADGPTGTIYEFRAKGLDLYWDPSQRITDLTPAEVVDPGEDSPGVGIVVLMALIAALAVSRRRM